MMLLKSMVLIVTVVFDCIKRANYSARR